MHKYALLLAAFILVSFSDTSLKKRISDANFRYEFYTTNKVMSPKENRQYYWFKGGAIHNSEYGMAGELLHEEYLKFYHSNQLAEGGKFKNGLKVGYWKSWFENGTLESKVYWKNGQKEGKIWAYDATGELIETGRYKDNLKHGTWINYKRGDTLKYREGKLRIKKEKIKKEKDSLKENEPGFLKRLFSKKRDTIAKVQVVPDRSIQQPSQRNAAIIKPQQQNKENKDDKKGNFFTRLFGKKNKSNTQNVKGT